MHQARKRLGQHFLHDKHIIDKIIRAIDPRSGDQLVEIGSGQGALTFPLLKQCKHLTAVELDRNLASLLQQGPAAGGELEIVNADILEFELNGLPGGPFRIVGNLPYNISTPLMFHLLDSIGKVQDMHFMVQKEVARRIVAHVSMPDYSRLSVMIQNYCDCQYLFDVAPASFTPPPKVDSAVIRMTPYPVPIVGVKDFQVFSEIVRSAFNQRRKTIMNSLKSIVDGQIIKSCAIDTRLRAENLSLQDYANLARAKIKPTL